MDRPWQPEIVTKIADGLLSGGKRRWIIDAPTGSGKTLMAMNLSARLSSRIPDLKTYVAVRTKNEMNPYDETNRRFGLNIEIKYRIGKSRLCDVYSRGDETNAARCDIDLKEFEAVRDGKTERLPPRKRVDTSGLADYYSKGLPSIYDLVGSEICPYISNRYRMAPFTVMTYNHLLNREIRSRSRVDLAGSLLIVDEAHNLETAAGSSLDITAGAFARAAEEYAKMFGTLYTAIESYRHRWDNRPVPRVQEVEDAASSFKGLLEEFSKPEAKKDPAPLRAKDDIDDAYHEGARLQDKTVFTARSEKLRDEYGVILTASAAIEFTRNLLMVTQPKVKLRNPFHSITQFVSALIEDEDQNAFGLFSESRGHVSLKPIDPATTLGILNGAKFLVMMSGTMPKKTYIEKVWGIKDITETSVLQDYRQEYHRVFPRANLQIEVTKDRQLTTRYTYRQSRGESLWESYARLIDDIHLKRRSRHSTLVCVPSYSIAQSIFSFLKVGSKFIESRQTSVEDVKRRLFEADEPMIVVAVSHGKLLEGVELVDDGRSLIDLVVVAGIPYPVPDDVYKIRRDRILRRLGIPQGSKEAKQFEQAYLKHQPALTGVKQAIGRAIRNPADRAKIFLADHRFNEMEWRKDLRLEEYSTGDKETG